ncbi:MAG: metal ABC transporter permease, partial [Chloroflexota bacterium]
YLGAAVTGVLSAVAITWVGRTARVPLDTAIGIIFAGVFALGVLMMSRVRNYTVDLFAFVFGNVLGVGPDDLIAIAIMGVLVLLFVLLLYKELLFTAYDPTMAAASGVPVVLLQYLLMIVLGLTTIVTLRAVGIVLAVAMLVTPAATALLLVRRFHHIMLVAVGVSLICAVVGLYLSYYLAVASGAAIVLVTTLAFLLALLFSPQRGLLARSKPSPV